MKDLLASEHRHVLQHLASLPVLLAFDFDGTLAPIVADRTVARMRPATRRLFAELCRRYPCAVISGRSRRDVRARLAGVRVRYVVGNHGLEPGGKGRRWERQVHEVRQARAALALHLDAWRGVDLEDKRYSLALHFRAAQEPARVGRQIVRTAETLRPRVRVVAGKDVVNILPLSGPSKGDALVELCGRARAKAVFYVGDDVTDEDVFREPWAGRLVGARIGRSARSRAEYFLRRQADIDRLLALFVRLRGPRRSAKRQR